MQSLLEQIKTHEEEINAFNPANAAEQEAYRIKYLGTKGLVKQVFGEMKNVPADQKKEAGQVLNAFKQLAEAKLESFAHLANGNSQTAQLGDISLPGNNLPLGTRHPLRITENEIVSIFEKK